MTHIFTIGNPIPWTLGAEIAGLVKNALFFPGEHTDITELERVLGALRSRSPAAKQALKSWFQEIG